MAIYICVCVHMLYMCLCIYVLNDLQSQQFESRGGKIPSF